MTPDTRRPRFVDDMSAKKAKKVRNCKCVEKVSQRLEKEFGIPFSCSSSAFFTRFPGGEFGKGKMEIIVAPYTLEFKPDRPPKRGDKYPRRRVLRPLFCAICGKQTP